MLKDYYYLTKPGIIRGNVMNTAGGLLLAMAGNIDLWLLIATLCGTALVIASACVFNNYLDRRIDSKMARTSKRALVNGRISVQVALSFGLILGITGFAILALWTNALTVYIGLVSVVMYVAVYGYFKRRSPIGTLIGTIPGALPPVAGYVAVTNQLDTTAALIFVIMACWQMAHFYSIGMYRHNDYKAAGLPILPVVHGMKRAKKAIVGYILAFIIANVLLSIFGPTGYAYAVVMTGISLAWLRLGLKHYQDTDDVKWGKRMFIFSLSVILTLAVMWAFGALLP